ncbi:hypothetical protein FISHEDRAFT_55184 [Fistulina hepatica ATCC 64428]|uniref:Uncharacterized protein n=1 Tax=Fistulina hepatica ATCC 64428 TaxID=1128425 RepID=A0A0D7ANW5_9AGAR|nr:hypothetical protein FISHEDRAFT_55184 [Fistulina hepatica ATCC 64428]
MRTKVLLSTLPCLLYGVSSAVANPSLNPPNPAALEMAAFPPTSGAGADPNHHKRSVRPADYAVNRPLSDDSPQKPAAAASERRFAKRTGKLRMKEGTQRPAEASGMRVAEIAHKFRGDSFPTKANPLSREIDAHDRDSEEATGYETARSVDEEDATLKNPVPNVTSKVPAPAAAALAHAPVHPPVTREESLGVPHLARAMVHAPVVDAVNAAHGLPAPVSNVEATLPPAVPAPAKAITNSTPVHPRTPPDFPDVAGAAHSVKPSALPRGEGESASIRGGGPAAWLGHHENEIRDENVVDLIDLDPESPAPHSKMAAAPHAKVPAGKQGAAAGGPNQVASHHAARNGNPEIEIKHEDANASEPLGLIPRVNDDGRCFVGVQYWAARLTVSLCSRTCQH